MYIVFQLCKIIFMPSLMRKSSMVQKQFEKYFKNCLATLSTEVLGDEDTYSIFSPILSIVYDNLAKIGLRNCSNSKKKYLKVGNTNNCCAC